MSFSLATCPESEISPWEKAVKRRKLPVTRHVGPGAVGYSTVAVVHSTVVYVQKLLRE